MDRDDSALKRYTRSISDALPCSGRAKKQIVSQIRESIVDYLREHREADLATVQAHFGTPQEIAAGYVDAQEAPALLRKMRNKKKVLMIVAGVMVAVLLIWSGYIAWAAATIKPESGGTVEVTSGID